MPGYQQMRGFVQYLSMLDGSRQLQQLSHPTYGNTCVRVRVSN
jgi:hypothetical protein